MQANAAPRLVAVALAALVVGLVLMGLDRPLLWADEGETAMYATRILEYGVPRVHAADGVVYELPIPMDTTVRESLDAFVGSPWGQYYFGAIGAALARLSTDPWARTGLLRLPFALAGLGAIFLLLTCLWRALGEPSERRPWVSIAYLALVASSVSLQLHFREARYYPLVALEMACAVYVYLRHRVFRDMGWAAYAAYLTLILVVTLNTFLPAFASMSAAIVANEALEASRRPPPQRLGEAFRGSLPVALAALVGVPCLMFYGTFDSSAVLTESFVAKLSELERTHSIGRWTLYLRNLRELIGYVLRYEWIATALLLLCARTGGRILAPPRSAPDTRAARFLWLVVAAHVLVVPAVPWFFTRYVVVLGPLACALVVLEAVLLGRQQSTRWPVAPSVVAAALAILIVVGMVLRTPELGGRLRELVEPVVGPLDVAVSCVREIHPQPEQLVIATNYESTVWMFSLGATALVGHNPDAARNAPTRLTPDVIMPRPVDPFRPPNQHRLEELSRRGRWVEHYFPIKEVGPNNTPDLWMEPNHRFETARTEDARDSARMLVRMGSDLSPPPPGCGLAALE